MKLLSITTTNWRQFRGRQTIEFAADAEKNTTVLFGTNGAGKTTLLNAVRWALFGDQQLEPNFRDRSRLLERQVDEDLRFGVASVSEVRVQLDFEFHLAHYSAERWITYAAAGNRTTASNPQFSLRRRNLDGTTDLIADDDAVDLIHQILPPALAPYFFFTGEDLSVLVEAGAIDLSNAVKSLLGLTPFERALAHTKQAIDQLKDEIEDLENDDRLRLLRAEELKLEHECKDLDDELRLLESQAAIEELNKSKSNETLMQFDAIRELVAERDLIIQDLPRLKAERDAKLKRELRGLSATAVLPLIDKMSDKPKKYAELFRMQKFIPADFQRQFVEDLLEKESCICGRPLHVESTEWECVTKLISRAGLPEVTTRWTELKVFLHALPARVNDAREMNRQRFDRREEAEATHGRALDRKMEIDGEIDRHGLGSDSDSAIQDAKARLAEADARLDELSVKTTSVNFSRGAKSEQLEAKRREVDAALAQATKQRVVLRRLEHLRHALGKLEAMKTQRSEFLRTELESRISEISREMFLMERTAMLDDLFRLSFVEGDGITSYLSQGENVIKSFAFILAVTDLARSLSAESSDHDGVGAVTADVDRVPFVLDSPFSALDTQPAHKVARLLPSTSHQVVVFLREDAQNVVKLDEFANRVGAWYVGTDHLPKSPPPKFDESDINVDGKEMPYIRHVDAKHRYTRFSRV